jgi:hypothetical protein
MAEETAPPLETTQEQPDPNRMMTFTDLENQVAADELAQAGQGQPQQVSDQQVAPPVEDKPVDPFTDALQKKGIKTPEDLLKSYEEAHVTITRLFQERAKMAQDMDVLMQMQNQFAQNQTAPAAEGQGDFNDELYKEIAPKVQAEARAQAQAILQEERMRMKVTEMVKANPEEFQELNPIMLKLLEQYPQVGALPNGPEMLYEKAKEVRTQRIGRLLKSVFGPEVDMDKMREFFKSSGGQSTQPPVQNEPAVNQDVARAAYLPAGSSASQQTQKPVDYNTQIQNLIQSGPKDRTFVDQVTDAWWNKNMNNPAVLTEAQLRNRR